VAILCGGIGTTNTAVATTKIIADFDPQYILFSGSAGVVHAKLNIGDVIILKKNYSLDYGDQNSPQPTMSLPLRNPIKNINEPIFFYSHENILKLAKKIDSALDLYAHDDQDMPIKGKIIIGNMASGDHFPNTPQDIIKMQKNSVDSLDMEGASMMKVCWIFNKNCSVIRGISNMADHSITNKYLMWNDANRMIGEKNAAMVTVEIIKNLD
jgi:adenosylhomocysteine nucleosidase